MVLAPLLKFHLSSAFLLDVSAFALSLFSLIRFYFSQTLSFPPSPWRRFPECGMIWHAYLANIFIRGLGRKKEGLPNCDKGLPFVFCKSIIMGFLAFLINVSLGQSLVLMIVIVYLNSSEDIGWFCRALAPFVYSSGNSLRTRIAAGRGRALSLSSTHSPIPLRKYGFQGGQGKAFQKYSSWREAIQT